MSQPELVHVDGHEFAVRIRPDAPGVYDFDWRTGPPDYGFTSAGHGGMPLTSAEIEDAIRGFLAMVDPQTGYIRD